MTSRASSRAPVVVAAVLAGVLVFVLALVVVAASAGAGGAALSVSQLAASTCVVSGPVPGLSAARAANADVVVSAALAALLAVPGWASMPPWLAAQAVQRSVYANGSNYQANWSQAMHVTAAVLGHGNQSGSCGQGTAGLTAATSGHGLPAGYRIPAGTPPEHAKVVTFALAQLGKPYVWAAAGPGSYDCSGLTMAAWASVGVPLQHYTGAQQHEGVAVSAAQLVPGDLVLVPGSDAPAPGIAGHVGIYLGDGLVESAIDPAQGVAVQSWPAFTAGGTDALRDPAPGR